MGEMLMFASFCCLLLLVKARNDNIISIKDAFEKYMIVPQCIPNAPKDMIDVIFDTDTILPGDFLHPFETVNVPFVSYPNNPHHLYCFVLFDPDIPFLYQPMGGQLLQVMFVNIPGKDIHAGERLGVYVPHIPYPGSGTHRCVYLIYKQPYRIQITAELRYRLSTNLTNFDMFQFATDFKLGDPIAGNFFVSNLTACDFNQPPVPSRRPSFMNECY